MKPHNDPTPDLGALALQHSDHVDAMLGYWDKHLFCQFANRAYVDWFGKTKEELIGKIHLSELLGPLYEKNLPHINGVLAGTTQVFEREIPIAGTRMVKHTLATYYPEKKDGETVGFFAHVADVTHIKELEKRLSNARRELLRTIIETEENHKRRLVDNLRENINQKLVACKLLIEGESLKTHTSSAPSKISSLLKEIIGEIDQLCDDIAPTEIEMLGLVESAKFYLDKLAATQQKKVQFVCENNSIEEINLKDKFSIFRIVQSLMTIALHSEGAEDIVLTITHEPAGVKIRLSTSGNLTLNKTSKEYCAIACRVDSYGGKILDQFPGSENIFTVEFEC